MSQNLNIIFEDKDLIVINKPAGLLVHPTEKNETNTLVDRLLAHFPAIAKVGEDLSRPGIVHRLDKDTSGLLIVAKNNKAFYFLKSQFQDRKIEKKYLALVHGQVKDQKGTITKAISLSKKGKRSTLLDDKSRPAWTEYRVIKRYKDYTLLEVIIKTGRTHQIRVHLSSIGHPIVGDKQYKFKRQITPDGLTRQFLHAGYLKFSLISGKIIELKLELPDDLNQILKNL